MKRPVDNLGRMMKRERLRSYLQIAAGCVLGGLAFLSGLLALIIRNQTFWQVSFYLMSTIIILKVLLTEAYRIVHYLAK